MIEDDLADVWPERAIAFLGSLAMGRTLAEGVPFVLGRLENDDAAEALLACGPNHPARALVVERVRVACLSLLDRLDADRSSEDSFNGWRFKRARETDDTWFRWRPVISRGPDDDTEPTPGEVDDGRPVLAWDAVFIAWARGRFPGHSAVADFTEGAADRWETWATGKGEQLDLAPGGRLAALWRPWVANAMPDRVEPVEGTVEGTPVDLNDPSFWASYEPPQRFTRLAVWITRVVWDGLRDEIGDSLEAERARERERYPISALLDPVARAHPGTMLEAGGGVWQVNAVDAGILEQLQRSGALETTAAAAFWLKLPDLARIAANNQGRQIVVWEGEEGAVLASMTTGNRTEIDVRGGYQALAACLGLNGGDARTALKATAIGLAKVQLQWWKAGGSEGITSLLGDLNEHPGRVTFILPRLLWPGLSAELRDQDQARLERRRVPVHPDLPPTTNAQLSARVAQLDLAGRIWIRDHLDQIEGIVGATVPWEDLAEKVKLSKAERPARRRTVLMGVLELWVERRWWHRTGELWRPDYGWSGPGSLLEALEQRKGGQRAQNMRAKKQV